MTQHLTHQRALSGSPDLLQLHALDPDRYPFLLASAAGASDEAQFDMLFAFPGETLVLDAQGCLRLGPRIQPDNDFLHALGGWCRSEGRQPADDPGLPFCGGWFVYAAYELANQIEPWLDLPAADGPVASAVRIPAAIIQNRATGATQIVAESDRAELIDLICADVAAIAGPRSGVAARPAGGSLITGPPAEEDPERFLAAVSRVQEHIAAGDVYQANISRQWYAQLAADTRPWQIFERLRQANPAPFAGLARLGDIVVVSSSPERLLRIRGSVIETRPIAGTRPRGQMTDDRSLVDELIANPKERAEHVMLIDLERNDLGKVCTPGSVRIADFMTIESYAHVHHIVSGVIGELRPEIGAAEALRAVFPGGTITGCPKPRCMALIRDIEQRPRGAYTGTFGYIGVDGRADFNILIRTIVLHDRQLTLAAGSGIVADSIPRHELAETRAKARGMLLALE